METPTDRLPASPILDSGTSPSAWGIPPGWTLVYRESTGSTNDDAKRAARAGASGCTVFLADGQTLGRGRHGRTWIAPNGSCLLFSVLLEGTLKPTDYTAAASLAVVEAIAATTDLSARIKWPNDVMIQERKVCGILTEVVTAGDRVATVVGLGLNVNLDLATAGLPATATSLAAEAGHSLPRAPLFSSILAYMDDLLSREPSQVPNLRQSWDSQLWRRSQVVRLSDGVGVVEGVVEGLAPSGALRLRRKDGTISEVTTGELLLE